MYFFLALFQLPQYFLILVVNDNSPDAVLEKYCKIYYKNTIININYVNRSKLVIVILLIKLLKFYLESNYFFITLTVYPY